MILVRRCISESIESGVYRLIGVWPIQSARSLENSIDEHCEPIYGNQFTIIRLGGISFDNGVNDNLIELRESKDYSGDLKFISYGISDEIEEKLYRDDHDFYWVKHAISKRLDALQMSMPECYLEPAGLVSEVD